jgi:hypothetical protein
MPEPRCGDAAAGVLDDELGVQGVDAQPQGDLAAWIRELQSVVDQIGQGLRDAPAVAAQARRLGGDDVQGDVLLLRFAREIVGELVQQADPVDLRGGDLQACGPDAGGVDEVIDQSLHPLDGPQDDRRGALRRRVALEHRTGQADGVEWVAQVMGHDREDLVARLGSALGIFARAPLELLCRLDVADVDGDTAQDAVAVLHLRVDAGVHPDRMAVGVLAAMFAAQVRRFTAPQLGQQLEQLGQVVGADTPLEKLGIEQPLVCGVTQNQLRVLTHEGVRPEGVVVLPDDGMVERVHQPSKPSPFGAVGFVAHAPPTWQKPALDGAPICVLLDTRAPRI